MCPLVQAARKAAEEEAARRRAVIEAARIEAARIETEAAAAIQEQLPVMAEPEACVQQAKGCLWFIPNRVSFPRFQYPKIEL